LFLAKGKEFMDGLLIVVVGAIKTIQTPNDGMNLPHMD
jgi:hypothetical protein